MHLLKTFLAILVTAVPLHATRTLLPPSAMHPIKPADLSWHLGVTTPPDEYQIYLEPGYTISAHLKTLGKDLSHQIRRRWEDPEIFEFAHYLVCLPEQEDLDLIRRDPGVRYVVESAEYQMISDPIVEENENCGGKHVEL
ncbi:hypothetical protein KCU73_g11128, partial [Aureobasidium melanogenum]